MMPDDRTETAVYADREVERRVVLGRYAGGFVRRIRGALPDLALLEAELCRIDADLESELPGNLNQKHPSQIRLTILARKLLPSPHPFVDSDDARPSGDDPSGVGLLSSFDPPAVDATSRVWEAQLRGATQRRRTVAVKVPLSLMTVGKIANLRMSRLDGVDVPPGLYPDLDMAFVEVDEQVHRALVNAYGSGRRPPGVIVWSIWEGDRVVTRFEGGSIGLAAAVLLQFLADARRFRWATRMADVALTGAVSPAGGLTPVDELDVKVSAAGTADLRVIAAHGQLERSARPDLGPFVTEVSTVTEAARLASAVRVDLLAALVLALVVAAVLGIGWWRLDEAQTFVEDAQGVIDQAEAGRTNAETRTLANDLAVRAFRAESEQPDIRLLTAVAADRLSSTPTTQAALLRGLLETPGLSVLLPGHTEAVIDLQRSADGSVFATADAVGAVRTWTEDGELLAGPIEVAATEVLLDSAGATLATVDRDGLVTWFDAKSGSAQHREAAPDGARVKFGCDIWGCGRPFAGISPDGSTVALAMRLPDGRSVVRFAGPDRDPVEVPVTGQITGLLWHGRDPLFVADEEGIREWRGDRGPTGPYVYEFGQWAGILPGGADYVENGTIESPLSDPTLAIVVAEFDASAMSVVFISRDDGEWVTSGAAVGEGFTESSFSEAPLAAIASTWPGQVWMATDPSMGGEPVPLVIDATVHQARFLMTGWNLPGGGIIRLSAGDDNVVAIAGFDPVVRVIGGQGGVLALSSTELEAMLFSGAEPQAAMQLPEVVEGDRGLSSATETADHSFAVGVYARDGTGIGDPIGDTGPVRVVDGDGNDVTPEHLRSVQVTAATLDGDAAVLFTGNLSGEIERTDLATGERLDGSRVVRRPVQGIGISPGGEFLTLSTDQELMIIDPATLNIIKTLAATETSAYLQDALFLTPSMRGTNSTYDDKGNLWFGWMRSVGEEVMLGMGPFGSDTVVPSQWLPGSTNHEDYGSSVVLLLEDLAGMACDVVNRDLTDDEWASLAVDSDRPEVCPGKTEPISSSAPLLERDVEDDRDDG